MAQGYAGLPSDVPVFDVFDTSRAVPCRAVPRRSASAAFRLGRARVEGECEPRVPAWCASPWLNGEPVGPG
jgi:hypothetical protein